MKLYNLKLNEDGSTKVETELSPVDMQMLLLMGFYACIERGLMLKSLAHHFITGDNGPVEVEVKDEREGSLATEQETLEISDWEAALEGTIKNNDDKA